MVKTRGKGGRETIRFTTTPFGEMYPTSDEMDQWWTVRNDIQS